MELQITFLNIVTHLERIPSWIDWTHKSQFKFYFGTLACMLSCYKLIQSLLLDGVLVIRTSVREIRVSFCDVYIAWFSQRPPLSALTLGRRRNSRSSWCRGRPPSCLTWAESGGWRQHSRSEKPGPQTARCQCSDRRQSRSLVGCHTCEGDTQYLDITHLHIL